MGKQDLTPWMPRHIVIQWTDTNDYLGTPFKKYRPESEYTKIFATESARLVNSRIKFFMWKSKKHENKAAFWRLFLYNLERFRRPMTW